MYHDLNRGLLLYAVLGTVFTLIALSPFGLEAQTTWPGKKPRAGTPKTQSSKAQNQKPQLLFNYYPAVLGHAFKESEYVFLAIAKDGSTQAVHYGPYDPAIIAVYEGMLPKADVTRLVSRAESVIPKASEINTPYVGSCDADQFQLSLSSQTRSATQLSMPGPACLIMMPEEIRGVVEEMRTIGRRLNKARLARGYVRSFPLTKDFLKSSQWKAEYLVSIRKFPRKLRDIVRDASRQTPKFYELDQAQYARLKSLASDPAHFYVIDSGRAHSLTLYLSR